ncbi:MAG: MotA/TolQ/ExbB proton channel family protein [Planctomycetes bacterium]|nr:MotA/TolQ/ExbB proton channel family protein [Planctomycetota bacterium]
MNRSALPFAALLLAASSLRAAAQETPAAAPAPQVFAEQAPPPAAPAARFAQATDSLQAQLEQSLAELESLRSLVADEKVPLSRQLRDLESELLAVRLEFQEAQKALDGRTLEVTNLKSEIAGRKAEASYVTNLLGEYVTNFESRLHIAELQRHGAALSAAKLAAENPTLAPRQLLDAQAGLLDDSFGRIEESLGGRRFEGSALGAGGMVRRGSFVLLGPAVLFLSDDGKEVGAVEQRVGSLEASVIPFADPEDARAAERVVASSAGRFPIDPSLGNAHKIEETEEPLLDHILAGGPVMWPIFAVGAAAFLVALGKWLSMAFLRKPVPARMAALLAAVGKRDREAAAREAADVGGPTGRMVAVGVAHLDQPRELIEEVMYEQVLATKSKLQRFLPFVALSATAAPLLGLLGTVTGIMNTFKLITVFGTGDVKTLSSGISEALITTEYGLIVAIPSLLLHALLNRKAKAVVDEMERAAIALLNEFSKTAPAHAPAEEAAAA